MTQSPPAAPQRLKIERDLRTLARFVEVFCEGKHAQERKSAFSWQFSREKGGPDGPPVLLCANCEKLLTHAVVKRTHCPMSPKPACKHCPQHCYHLRYRDQIRQVMRYSGTRLLLRGRLDYLIHLFL